MEGSRARRQLVGVASGRHLRGIALGAAAAVAVAGGVAPAASAKNQTLRFYQVSGPAKFSNAAGHPININPQVTPPVAGDSFDEIDLDFVGTAKHHAKRSTASDHVACTFTNGDTALCNQQIAVGGSMLLSNNVTFHFNLPNPAIAINECTGAYRGDHGTWTDVNLPNSQNAILTVRLS